MPNVQKRLSTVKNLSSLYPDAGFTESTIRWLIFNKNENGFSSCICRMGRKILIDLDAFESWLDSEAANGGAQ
jgi:hypothetical protein